MSHLCPLAAAIFAVLHRVNKLGMMILVFVLCRAPLWAAKISSLKNCQSIKSLSVSLHVTVTNQVWFVWAVCLCESILVCEHILPTSAARNAFNTVFEVMLEKIRQVPTNSTKNPESFLVSDKTRKQYSRLWVFYGFIASRHCTCFNVSLNSFIEWWTKFAICQYIVLSRILVSTHHVSFKAF